MSGYHDLVAIVARQQRQRHDLVAIVSSQQPVAAALARDKVGPRAIGHHSGGGDSQKLVSSAAIGVSLYSFVTHRC